jgi:hypothetical protein
MKGGTRLKRLDRATGLETPMGFTWCHSGHLPHPLTTSSCPCVLSAFTEHLLCVRTCAKPIRDFLSTGSNTAVTSKSVGQEWGYVYWKLTMRDKGRRCHKTGMYKFQAKGSAPLHAEDEGWALAVPSAWNVLPVDLWVTRLVISFSTAQCLCLKSSSLTSPSRTVSPVTTPDSFFFMHFSTRKYFIFLCGCVCVCVWWWCCCCLLPLIWTLLQRNYILRG